MAKILMVNLPYAGHTNPTLPLTKCLVERGHEVGYIHAPEWCDKIEKTGANFIPYLDYPVGLSEQQKKRRCFLAAFQTVMAIGKNYDLLIYEMLFFPAKRLADRLGIPSVRQFSQPAWNQEAFQSLSGSSKMFLLSSRLIGKQLMNSSAARAMKMEELKMVDSVINDVPELNIVYLPDFFQPMRSTFDQRFIFVPPAFVSHQPSDVSIPFDQMTGPIIYISLGTIISSKRFYRKCIAAFKNKSVSVILSTGKVDPQTLGKLPANIYAYPFVPQLEVLKKSALFITHGGMNSVCEAMTYGVPMLVLPVLNDQPINAAQVTALKIGKRLNFLRVSAKELSAEAFGILSDDEIQRQCLVIQKKLQFSMKSSDAAAAVEKYLSKKTPIN